MIRADQNEIFPITAMVIDENTGLPVSGQTVYYDIRDLSDNPLVPALNGVLIESTVEAGVYKKNLSIPVSGTFVCYASCSGYLSGVEEVIINEENLYVLTKNNRHFNISSEDVIRSNVVPTTSQVARNVPFGRTDYILTKIKRYDEVDWSATTISGLVYAHYRNNTDALPFRMGGEF